MAGYIYHDAEALSLASIEQSPLAQSLASELQNPAQPGERHTQIKRTILPMLELGLCDRAVFEQYRGMYDADVTDEEIIEFIRWARAKLTATGKSHKSPVKKPKLTPEQKVRNAIDWLGGFRIDPADLWEASQIYPGEESDAVVYLSLFQSDDFVNLNTRYRIRKLKDGTEKAELYGPGFTMVRIEWIDCIRQSGVPQDRAGTWVRVNPLRSKCGNSKSGAHTDSDVLRYARFFLKSDVLPFEIALSLLAKVRLPVCAIVDSAGRGPHGIVCVDAIDASDYACKVRAIIKFLEPLGIDPGNSNPSRYSRLPGAERIIGARADASVQKLLYIAPNPRPGGIFS